jgi:hypothetical protein
MHIVSTLRTYLRTRLQQPIVRPLALVGPIAVLLVALPLLRPLRHPSSVSPDEVLRLATIRALVQDGTLDIRHALPERYDHGTVRRGEHLYSEQPPMMALLLAPAAWVMYKSGLSLEGNFVPYMLTLLGTTLPVAVAAGLIYRMGRLFELRRPWRAGLAMAVVFGSGLISYAVVLNPHAPAAALVLVSAWALIYVAAAERAGRRWFWLFVAGLSAALASALDPAAAVMLVLFMFVIPAMRVGIAFRALGALLYLLGAAAPLLVHTRYNVPITGDWLPASLHEEFSRGRRSAPPATLDFDDEESHRTASFFAAIYRPTTWLAQALLGAHGILSHFPVIVIGVAGVFAVMHRHWPVSTKTLAAATLAGSITILLLYCIFRADWDQAMFASRWFVVFLPMLLFWVGAWVRRQHKPAAWVFAGVLTGFSVLVGVVGATEPFPAEGFRTYTAFDATRRLISPQPSGPAGDVLVNTDRGRP